MNAENEMVPATNPLSMQEQITVSMASIPARITGMLQVVEALLPQCDQFIVNLNGYPDISHELLENPKLHVIHAPLETGARGKFAMTHTIPGYHIIVDDDIAYPPDYVYTMIQHIEKFKRQAIVGAHGKLFLYRRPPNPMSHILYGFSYEVSRYYPVHMLGTGVMAYHSCLLQMDPSTLLPGKIDDQVALYCQENAIPCVVVPHKAGWIKDMEDISLLGSLRRNMPLRQEASERILNYPNWRLYTPDEDICFDV